MRYQPKRQRDRQRVLPVHQCACCGGELYPGGACWKIHGRVCCEACLRDWVLSELRCFRYACGEVEE